MAVGPEDMWMWAECVSGKGGKGESPPPLYITSRPSRHGPHSITAFTSRVLLHLTCLLKLKLQAKDAHSRQKGLSLVVIMTCGRTSRPEADKESTILIVKLAIQEAALHIHAASPFPAHLWNAGIHNAWRRPHSTTTTASTKTIRQGSQGTVVTV